MQEQKIARTFIFTMNDEFYMSEALKLAAKGWPEVAPNPMVGCVIVHGDQVVASGYHQAFGQAHAEVNAIKSLPNDIAPSDCTVYVSLEPCSHFGKTPPCADLLIQQGFKRVVVAGLDPNPLVAGRGITKLKEAGIEVKHGVMEEEAAWLNRRFMTFHRFKRPYVILKWAMTEDGFISRIPLPDLREENIITGQKVKEFVHRLRAEVMAILVGKNTVLADNPQLTTRMVPGKNPLRVVIDRQLQIPRHFQIYKAEAPTVIFNAVKEEKQGNIRFMKLNFDSDILPQLLQKLAELQIQSVLVEGGTETIQAFLAAELWDEALVFQNPALAFKKGLKGPVFALKNSFELLGNDKMYHHFRNETMSAKSLGDKEIF